MSLLSLPPLERLHLARLRKQDFSQIVQHWPLPATQNAVFAFSNTTASKDNLETVTPCLAWQLVKITDYFRVSFPKAPCCFLLGWREVGSLQAGFSDWPFAHWPAVVPQEPTSPPLALQQRMGYFSNPNPNNLVSTPAQPHSLPTRVNGVSRHFWEENHLAYSRCLP